MYVLNWVECWRSVERLNCEVEVVSQLWSFGNENA